MTVSPSEQRARQMAEAEELLADQAQHQPGFVQGLFFGEFRRSALPDYPRTVDDTTRHLLSRLGEFCQSSIDPVVIDRNAEIPREVVVGLGKLGVLGACLPRLCGGLDLSQASYCRLLEVLGGHCASTALFVNAHHSIGPRAIVLFGTDEQKRNWLPKLASGEWISAFALTEPEAGSDAANVQTLAVPSQDGASFIVNGEKRWITNGGIAQVLTVMARTPVPGRKGTHISSFLVTPHMPGFRVVEQRMSKCGVRGTATSRLAFENMVVPRENLLGPLGKGLKVALTVLDFGRTTFGACCTGAAKFCVERAIQHSRTRRQFQQTLGSFELVKEKLAYMQAGTYAMEACTYQTAALIDAGTSDYMLETAMLKVFATDTLWRIIHDTFQLHGGKAYFTDEPFERMLRDARINMIGEGANDVLRAFTALVGLREVGLDLQAVLENVRHPFAGLGAVARFAARKAAGFLTPPEIGVRSPELEPFAAVLGQLIQQFASAGERLLRTHRQEIVDRQYLLGRTADAATELYVSACVLRRLDAELRDHHRSEADRQFLLATGRYYLTTAARRIRRNLADLWSHDDAATTDLADRMLGP